MEPAGDGWRNDQGASRRRGYWPQPHGSSEEWNERTGLRGRGGIPLAVGVAPGNRNDCKLGEPTLEARRVLTPALSQHPYLDKGYDFTEVAVTAMAYSFIVPHTLPRGGSGRDGEVPEAETPLLGR